MADFESNDESKADISSLLEVNRLDYRLPPSLSIATSRAMKVYVAQQSSHVAGGSTLQFTLSSGATYVDFLNSYLKYTVQMPDSGLTASINPKMSPHTGWANMIKQVRIVHSSGVELDRMKTSVGEWIQIQNYYDRSEQCRRTQGSLYGLNDTGRASPLISTNELCERAKEGLNVPWDATAIHGDTLDTAAGMAFDHETSNNAKQFKVAIPLQVIMGFFNVDLLAPSFLSAGLQIYIDFYPPEHFFMCGTTNDGTVGVVANKWPSAKDVLIVKPEMHLETFTLTDSIVRKLSQISASSGLEWYFDSVHQMDGGTAESDYSIQITRALSRANNIIVKTRNKNKVGVSIEDSFGSQAWVVPVLEGGGTTAFAVNPLDDAVDGTMAAFQVQLGAQYIPSRSLQDKSEFIHSALKTFSQFRRSDEIGGPDGAQFTGYRTTVNAASTVNKYNLGIAISTVPLESSSTLQQSGAAISAQRTAVVNMTWANTGVAADSYRRVDAFVQYSKLATLFLDSVVVRS